MEILVLTNNLLVKENFKTNAIAVDYIEITAKQNLLRSRDCILKGWHLAADPRGGYNKRYNPYHTIFLCDDPVTNPGDDIIVLEESAMFSNSPYSPDSAFTARELHDFSIIDASIAERTFEHLKRYII